MKQIGADEHQIQDGDPLAIQSQMYVFHSHFVGQGSCMRTWKVLCYKPAKLKRILEIRKHKTTPRKMLFLRTRGRRRHQFERPGAFTLPTKIRIADRLVAGKGLD